MGQAWPGHSVTGQWHQLRLESFSLGQNNKGLQQMLVMTLLDITSKH